MTRRLIIHRAGPQLTVQDAGRLGLLGQGVSMGGAADPLALAEGAALLRQPADLAALEMAGIGGEFEATADCRIALTGAPMSATLAGRTLAWNASHLLPAGERLVIGAATAGSYGYRHLGGGIDTPKVLGSRAAHLAAGLGAVLKPGDSLPLGPDRGDEVGLVLDVDPRCNGGTIRMTRSMQTDLFDPAELARFQSTSFCRDARANRMGARLDFEGAPFAASGQLSILSEVIVPGDIQMTGDGAPFVLLPECQTTGGYPRIGTVIPADMPRVAQAGPGAALRFEVIGMEAAIEAQRRHVAALAALRSAPRPLIRRPHDIADLLSYQLIGGVISAHHEGD